MSGFLAIVASLIIPRLAPASRIFRRSGITSSSTVQLVGQTLYYIGVVSSIMYKRFPPSSFSQDGARDFRVLHSGRRGVVDSFDKSFPRRGQTTH